MFLSLKDLQENVGALPAESMMQFLCVQCSLAQSVTEARSRVFDPILFLICSRHSLMHDYRDGLQQNYNDNYNYKNYNVNKDKEDDDDDDDYNYYLFFYFGYYYK